MNKDRFHRWLHNNLYGFPRFEDFLPGMGPRFEDFSARVEDRATPMMSLIANLESINLSTCSLAKYKLWLILGYIAR